MKNPMSALANTVAILVVLSLLFVVASDALTDRGVQLPWGDSIADVKVSVGRLAVDVIQGSLDQFKNLTKTMEGFADWCGTPGECAGRIIKIAEAYGATFLVAVYTWVGVHIIERLPKAAFGQ
jgi:hypothetical protein